MALIISIEEASMQIKARIQKGKDILTECKEHTESEKRFQLWHKYNIDLLSSIFNDKPIPNEYRRSYSPSYNPYETPRPTEKELFARHQNDIKECINCLESIEERLKFFSQPDSEKEIKMNISKNQSSNTNTVFVVHGRNLKIKNSMFQFLRSIGVEPLEWLKAKQLTGKASPYIGEVLNIAFTHAQAVIVLFTPDDFAKLNPCFLKEDDMDYERNLTPQARPNVIFEAGMALGRNEDKTILVNFGGNLRSFSDISGRHLINFDGSPKSRNELISMLMAIGVEASIDGKEDWLTVGDFSIEHSIAIEENSTQQQLVSPMLKTKDKIIKSIYEINNNKKKLTTPDDLLKMGFSEVDIFNSTESAQREGLLENEFISKSLYNWSLTQKGLDYIKPFLEFPIK